MTLDSTFAALADPTRRALLRRLESGERTLSDLAAPLPISLMAVQKHVRILEDAMLVVTRKLGRSRYVRLNPRGLKPAADWVREYEARWNSALDRLDEYLQEMQATEGRHGGREE
jgi:DNA-binding transcriptional ArsR family regulator